MGAKSYLWCTPNLLLIASTSNNVVHINRSTMVLHEHDQLFYVQLSFNTSALCSNVYGSYMLFFSSSIPALVLMYS